MKRIITTVFQLFLFLGTLSSFSLWAMDLSEAAKREEIINGFLAINIKGQNEATVKDALSEGLDSEKFKKFLLSTIEGMGVTNHSAYVTIEAINKILITYGKYLCQFEYTQDNKIDYITINPQLYTLIQDEKDFASSINVDSNYPHKNFRKFVILLIVSRHQIRKDIKNILMQGITDETIAIIQKRGTNTLKDLFGKWGKSKGLTTSSSTVSTAPMASIPSAPQANQHVPASNSVNIPTSSSTSSSSENKEDTSTPDQQTPQGALENDLKNAWAESKKEYWNVLWQEGIESDQAATQFKKYSEYIDDHYVQVINAVLEQYGSTKRLKRDDQNRNGVMLVKAGEESLLDTPQDTPGSNHGMNYSKRFFGIATVATITTAGIAALFVGKKLHGMIRLKALDKQHQLLKALLKQAQAHDAAVADAYKKALPQLPLLSVKTAADIQKLIDAKNYEALIAAMQAECNNIEVMCKKNIAKRVFAGFLLLFR